MRTTASDVCMSCNLGEKPQEVFLIRCYMFMYVLGYIYEICCIINLMCYVCSAMSG